MSEERLLDLDTRKELRLAGLSEKLSSSGAYYDCKEVSAFFRKQKQNNETNFKDKMELMDLVQKKEIEVAQLKQELKLIKSGARLGPNDTMVRLSKAAERMERFDLLVKELKSIFEKYTE